MEENDDLKIEPSNDKNLVNNCSYHFQIQDLIKKNKFKLDIINSKLSEVLKEYNKPEKKENTLLKDNALKLLEEKKKKQKHLDNLISSQIQIDKIRFDCGIENPEVSKVMSEAKQVEIELRKHLRDMNTEEEFNEVVETNNDYKGIFKIQRNFNINIDIETINQGLFLLKFDHDRN